MNKRSLAFVCAFAAALVFAYWGWTLRETNQELQTAVKQAKVDLSFEHRRLEGLRASLAQVQKTATAAANRTQDNTLGTNPPADPAQVEEVHARINDLKAQIAQTEAQINTLRADKSAVTANSQDFKADTQMSVASQIIDLERQIQEINAQIARIKTQLAGLQKQTQTEDVAISIEDAQAEIQALTLTREQLTAQIQVVKAQGEGTQVAATQQAQSEQYQIFSEEQQLRIHLEDLRSDLDYWQNAQVSRTPAGQEARIAQLQKQIQELEQKIR